MGKTIERANPLFNEEETIFLKEAIFKSSGDYFNSGGYSHISKDLFVDRLEELIKCIMSKDSERLSQLAKDVGNSWAETALSPLMELRFLSQFRKSYLERMSDMNKEASQREVHFLLDTYILHFVTAFVERKRENVEEKADPEVPIIVLTETTALLPLMGEIETSQTRKYLNKVLVEADRLNLSLLIIDLSYMKKVETSLVTFLMKIVDAIRLIGCRAIVTGINARIAPIIMRSGIQFENKVAIKNSVKDALKE
ncbi:STAS domain-containing protein [Pseudalkalibacillus caeni]|uniref:STAS domain-containing protein n=1 Tax=Exobacillus caeni TaxID=2574798 RepID=A0A5R9FC67_9BACL|nr:STAS domain-containing protein [Pseudalkalibacillus caeni]TLS37245.1 STAS domain-containing protein [Pseudalkalibacillus caeni]